MLLETEHVALVEADTLEHAVSVEETVVENRNFCVRLIDELAIEIDLHRGGWLRGVGKIVESEPDFLLVRRRRRSLFGRP